MWNNAVTYICGFIRFIRRKSVLGIIFFLSLTYFLLNLDHVSFFPRKKAIHYLLEPRTMESFIHLCYFREANSQTLNWKFEENIPWFGGVYKKTSRRIEPTTLPQLVGTRCKERFWLSMIEDLSVKGRIFCGQDVAILKPMQLNCIPAKLAMKPIAAQFTNIAFPVVFNPTKDRF